MRKDQDEIIREVFGQGARWIGWNHWLQHQVIFKFIQHKVEKGIEVMSAKDFYIRLTKEGHVNTETMIRANIDKDTGDLVSVNIPCYDGKAMIVVKENSSVYWANTDPIGATGTDLQEMFDDPWKPTHEELDLFKMLYGDEQLLIDINKEFYGTVMKYNRAAGSNNVAIFYPVK